MSRSLLPRSAPGHASSLPPLSRLKSAHSYIKRNNKKQKTTPLNLISHGSSFRDFEPPRRPDMRPALYQPSAAAVGRMQICFICIETRPRPQCLPSHSIPPPTTLPTLLWRVLWPSIYIYIPHMLSDSRPPAAKHSLPCEGCQFVYMLMLLFPSRPPASSGRPLTIPLCSKVTRRSVVTLPDFTHTSGSGFSSNLLFFYFLPQLFGALCLFLEMETGPNEHWN